VKFLNNNISKIYSSEIASVEAIVLSDNEVKYNIVILKKAKNRLFIETTKLSVSSIDEIKTIVSEKTPICLVINGKGIIYRKINNINDETDVLNTILPNANKEDFLVEHDNTNFVTIVRKETVENISDLFSNNGYFIVELFIGPYTVKTLYPLLDYKSNILKTGFFNITFSNEEVDSYENLKEEEYSNNILVSGESVENRAIIPFSACLHFILEQQYSTLSKIDKIQLSSSEFIYSRIFKLLGIGVLSFMFVLLLSNFMIFNHYKDKSNLLFTEAGYYKDLTLKHNSLKKEVEDKTIFFKKIGLVNSSKISYYCDIIALTMPDKISLKIMDIFPAQKKSSQSDPIQFEKEIINIIGITKNSKEVNLWINKLKEYKWVKDISLIDYSYNSTEGIAEFKIKITVN